jgi:hypothetical protein
MCPPVGSTNERESIKKQAEEKTIFIGEAKGRRPGAVLRGIGG